MHRGDCTRRPPHRPDDGDAPPRRNCHLLHTQSNPTTNEQLGSNALGDAGAAALCGLVAESQVLRRLGLADNGITRRGLAALTRVLETNVTLSWLDVRDALWVARCG